MLVIPAEAGFFSIFSEKVDYSFGICVKMGSLDRLCRPPFRSKALVLISEQGHFTRKILIRQFVYRIFQCFDHAVFKFHDCQVGGGRRAPLRRSANACYLSVQNFSLEKLSETKNTTRIQTRESGPPFLFKSRRENLVGG